MKAGSSTPIYPFDADQTQQKIAANDNATVNAAPAASGVTNVYALPPHGKIEKLSEDEKQKRLQALLKAKEQNAKQLKHIDENIIFDSRYAEALKNYDANGDGQLDVEEILLIHNDLNRRKEQNNLLKRVVGVVLVALILLLLINGLLTSWVIKLTKDTKVNDDNGLTSTSSNQLLKTEKPRYYTTLTDLTKLPAAALNSLNRLSFTTADGGVHNYEVQGVRLNALNDTMATIYFTYGRTLSISSGKGIFTSVDSDGTISVTDLVVDGDTPVTTSALNRRRLQMLRSYRDEGKDYHSMLERCSYTQDVCYHTYDEILDLHNTPVNGRRLADTSSVTYAEITADVAVLTKDNRSGLQQAKSYLENVLGRASTDGKNGTIAIKFRMKERCANYVTLREYCKYYPAPLSNDQVDYVNFAPPFRGLEAEDSLWWFADEIEFWKDSYTIMLKVRYAHDIYRPRRMHVVLMDRARPTHIVSYDEVQSYDDPSNDNVINTILQTYIVNYKEESAVTGDGVGFVTGVDSSAVRRLAGWDDAEHNFHQHIRNTKIFGFPRLFVSDALLDADHYVHKGPVYDTARRLEEDNSLLIDAEVTTDGVYPMMTYADANGTSANRLNASVAQSLLPAGDTVTSDDVAMPVAVFSDPVIVYSKSLIRWPTLKDVTHIDEFELHQIPERIELALLKEQESKSSNSSIGTLASSRRLEEMPEHHRRLYSRAEERVALTAQRHEKRRDQVNQQFEALSRELDKIISHLDHFQPIHRAIHKHIQNGGNRKKTDIMIDGEEHHLIEIEDVHGRRLATSRTRPSRRALQGKLTNYVAKRLTKADFQNKIKSWLKKEAIPGLVADSVGNYTYGINTNSNCANLYVSWNNLYGHILFLYDVLDNLNSKAGTIDTALSVSSDVQSVLSIMENINYVMKPVTMIISKIPYIGPLFKGFAQIYDMTVKNVITPPNNKLKTINDKINSKQIKKKLNKFIETTDNLMLVLDAAGWTYHDFVVALQIVDKYCPALKTGSVNVNNWDSTVGSQVCLSIKNLLDPIVTELNNLTVQINSLLAGLNDIASFLSQLLSFSGSIDMNLFNTINVILNVINSFLDRRIEMCFPIDPCWWSYWVCSSIRYPCGIKKCRWFPCGIKWCSYDFCWEIRIPYLCLRCFSFTIRQIIDGVMSLLSWIEDIFNTVVEGLAKALGISFPTISIPGLPSLNFLDNIFNYFNSLFDYSLMDFNIDWNARLVNPLKGVCALLKSVIMEIDINTVKLDLGISSLSLPTLPSLPKCNV